MRSSFLIIWHFRICFSTFGKALISYKAILDVIRLIAYNDTDIKICRKIFSNDKYRRVVWQCNHKFDGGEKCTTPHLDEGRGGMVCHGGFHDGLRQGRCAVYL